MDLLPNNILPIEELVMQIGASAQSSFYQMIWREQRNFPELPILTPEMLASVPLRERLYTTKPGFVRALYVAGQRYLVKWDPHSFGPKEFGPSVARPLVVMSERNDTVEKAFWYYGHNILPAAGEAGNLVVTSAIAAAYECDALLTDTTVALHLLEKLEQSYELSRIKTVVLVDRSFPPDVLSICAAAGAQVHCVLALGETGALMQSCIEDGTIFHPDDSAAIELDGDSVVATKLSCLPTPIIRYRTPLKARTEPVRCSCGVASFSLV